MADGMKKVKVSVFFDKIPKKYKFPPVQILDKKNKKGYNIYKSIKKEKQEEFLT